MGKANPKAWFPNKYVARISHRKVDKWARSNEKYRPFFEVWKDAHKWMLDNAEDRLKKAKRELASAKRSLDKIKTMKEATP